MIEHIWTLICASVVIDQETNNISIFNILEQITIPEEGVKNNVIGIGINVVTLWVRSDLAKPAKGTSRLDLISPNGELIKSMDADIDLSEYERLRSRGIFQGLPYKGEGVYRFIMNYKINEKEEWQQVASVPFHVMVNKETKKEDARPRSRAKDKA